MRKTLVRIVAMLCLALSTGRVHAQVNRDPQLAAQYLQALEYDKAALIYEKLYDKYPNLYYNQYLQALVGLKDYSRAEKVVKRQVRASDNAPVFLVDLGYVYKLSGSSEKADQQFTKALKQMEADPQLVSALANAFLSRTELDYAIEAYTRGRKLLNGMYQFSFELAELYTRKPDIPKMMEEYLDILLVNESYLQNVQNVLQTNLSTDPDGSKNEFMKNMILKRIQSHPDRTIYSELLTWLFLQQKDFESAFIHARAMDKRLREDGSRIMYLASICLANESYDVAIRCYQYVLNKGNSSPNYIEARISLLNTSNKKLTQSIDFTMEELLNLEKEYFAAFKELGKNAGTAPLIRSLAHLQAFYLNKMDEAVASLHEAIDMPALNTQFKAGCKIELADILLMKGEIWDATLLYSQVDLDFKNNPIGEEAKYKNALLSYYNGDFEWARSQLDVLKSGTSHLIANDAMALSLLITDNIDPVDSNTVPLLLFSRADLLCYQNRFEEALAALDSITTLAPGHSLSDEILYKKAGIFRKRNKFTEAAGFLQSIVEGYPGDILADDAAFDLAELYEKKLDNIPKAMELYKLVMEKYTSSLYVVEARKRFRALRGDNLN
jgi:tetratricopeptide (TPR) repeat protein